MPSSTYKIDGTIVDYWNGIPVVKDSAIRRVSKPKNGEYPVYRLVHKRAPLVSGGNSKRKTSLKKKRLSNHHQKPHKSSNNKDKPTAYQIFQAAVSRKKKSEEKFDPTRDQTLAMWHKLNEKIKDGAMKKTKKAITEAVKKWKCKTN